MLENIKASYLVRGQLATFFMEYMNDPVSSEGANFKQEYFQYFEELPHNDPTTYETCEYVNEMFVDLGGGGLKRTADPTAMIVISTDTFSGKMYVQDYINEQMGVDTDLILQKLFDLARRYNVRKVYIEKTQAANMLVAALDRKLLETRAQFRVEYVSAPRGVADKRGNMSDGKFQRIAALEAPLKLGEIKIRRWMVVLIEQLLVFPRGQHDDLCDCLAYGYMFAKKKKRVKNNQWIPPSRHGYLNRKQYVT
jgi:predicted phage terminase large subunit-like protein